MRGRNLGLHSRCYLVAATRPGAVHNKVKDGEPWSKKTPVHRIPRWWAGQQAGVLLIHMAHDAWVCDRRAGLGGSGKSGRAKSVVAAEQLRVFIRNRYDTYTAAPDTGKAEGAAAAAPKDTIFARLCATMDKEDAVQTTLLFISALIPKGLSVLLFHACIELGGADAAASRRRDRARADPSYCQCVMREAERLYSPFFAARRIADAAVDVARYVPAPTWRATRRAVPCSVPRHGGHEAPHRVLLAWCALWWGVLVWCAGGHRSSDAVVRR